MEPIKRRPVPQRTPAIAPLAQPFITEVPATDIWQGVPRNHGTHKTDQWPVSHDVQSTQSGTSKAEHTARPHVMRVWIWELAAIAIAVGLMFAKFIILAHFDDQEIPKWPLFINLNTLIALLSMVQRAALLLVVAEIIGQAKWLWFADLEHPLLQLQEFHEASRSSLGALWLLFVATVNKARLGLRIIVLLAASITVLSFGIGPFAQQAINNKPCRRLYPAENATVPISHVAPGTLRYSRVGAGQFDPDASLKGTMLKGLTGSDDPRTLIDAHCPTGECEFPDFGAEFAYSSIGICSRCVNLTTAVQVANESRIPENHSMEPDYALLSVQPSNLSYAASYLPGDFGSSACSSFLNVSILTFRAGRCDDPDCEREEARKGQASVYSYEPEVVAVGCTLYPCLKNYRGSVHEGTLREDVVSTQPTRQYHQGLLEGQNSCHIGLNSNRSALQEPCMSDDGTWYTATNISEFPTDGRNLVDVRVGSVLIKAPEECVYTVDYEYGLALRLTLQSILDGSCTGNTRQGPKPYCWDAWWLDPLYNNGRTSVESISSRIEALATAMTNEFRRNGPVKDRFNGGALSLPKVALGQQFESTICTTFDWPWLLAPAVLTAITALLLAWVLVHNKFRETRQPAWKGSILPLLFYGLNSREGSVLSNTQSENCRLADLKDINERSRRTRVQFSNGADGASLGFQVRDDSIGVGHK